MGKKKPKELTLRDKLRADVEKDDRALRAVKEAMLGAKLPEICPDCRADPKVACPRDVDAECLHCGERRCGRHILTHLAKVHVVSIKWRGLLK